MSKKAETKSVVLGELKTENGDLKLSQSSRLLRDIAAETQKSAGTPKQVVVKANSEIKLECGKSSLLLRRDGTIVLKGVKIVSRASRTNKVRGGTVKIN